MNNEIFMTSNHGISQAQRRLNTLVPEYIQMDSRSIPDWIGYLHKISNQFNYYNEQTNEISGTWENFLLHDPYLTTLLISTVDVPSISNQFSQLVKNITGTMLSDQLDDLNALVQFTWDTITQLSQFQTALSDLSLPNNLEEVLITIIPITAEFKDFEAFCHAVSKKYKGFNNPNFKGMDLPQQLKNSLINPILIRETDANDAVAFIKELFKKIILQFNQLVHASVSYISRNPILEQPFEPQIGLLITFLNLYQSVQSKMNGFNRRHLDYYFKNILELKQKKGKPDSVHLIIEPEKGIKQLEIQPSNLLIAEDVETKNSILYELNNAIRVSAAKIVEIKTVFISQFAQIKSNDLKLRDIIEYQVYQASQKIFSPSEFKKNIDDFNAWPCLGEDQHGKLGNMRTMDTSNLGMYLTSPLLYLPEGERSISIKIHLNKHSFDSLKDYFIKYQKVKQKKHKKLETTVIASENKIEGVIYELLSNTFVITYTSKDNWETVKNYYVKFDPENEKEKTLEIIIRLGSGEPAIDTYNQSVHQLAFTSEFPMIRLGLNNYSKHYAYSYLQNININRITIKSVVSGFKSLILQNNIGLVSPVTPFHVFGPQPIVGTYLDIKNTNVFNRYLKDFSIAIDWLNLPREHGGFESYYHGYTEAFANTSFAVKLQALKSKNAYMETSIPQRKQLFDLKKNRAFLNDSTQMDQIDVRKLGFTNEPSLTSISIHNPLAVDGTLRMELCSPTEAFGHEIFPKIFPEAVLKQASKKGFKEPLPNQPIAPIIKSLVLDYTLEYSEVLDGEANSEGCKIQLIHDYPFGYEYIYPNKYKKNISLMPVFSDYNNLYIGIKDVEARSELNVLFKFKDYGFHYTLNKTVVKWSYLENNSWIPFLEKDIIMDSTNDLIGSGIVRLISPRNVSSNNTIMNPDLFWIKATTINKSGMKPNVIGISLNGVTATRKISQEAFTDKNIAIEPYVIKEFQKSIKGISQLWQPFSSTNGESQEDIDKFYIRVSERLRHKQRPVQNRDIVQVVLEHFPEIMMAKCFNTEVENYELVEGTNLHIVLIPRESKGSDFLKEAPKVSLLTLFEVKSFMDRLLSSFVKIEVGNAIYERVKVICKVVLTDRAKEDSANYLRILTQEINRYIAPWLSEQYDGFKLGNRIYNSDLLLFVKTRPYIEYVTAFSLVHFYDSNGVGTVSSESMLTDSAVKDSKFIECSSPASIFVPSKHHIITEIEKPIHSAAKQLGIGEFIIGEELLITEFLNEKPLKTELSLAEDEEDEGDEEYFNFIINHNN